MLALGLSVQAGDHPDQDPGPDRDGRPDPGAGPVPGRPAAVRVPAGRCRAAPEQGARRLGPPGAPAGAGPGHRAGRRVDVRAAAGRAQRRADHPRPERCRGPVPVGGRPGAEPAPHAARRGRCARSPRSWRTRGIPGGRCGTGSAPTTTWSTRPTPRWGTARCSGGTCPTAGSSPPARRTRRWSARPISSPPRTPAPPRGPAGPADPAVPAGRAAGLRKMRAAAGIGLVQRQARLPVPPRLHQRHPPQPRPAGEHLRPRGPDPAAPGRPGHLAVRRQPFPARQEPAGAQLTAPAQAAQPDRPSAGRRRHPRLRPGHASPADRRPRFPSRHRRAGTLTTRWHQQNQEGGQPPGRAPATAQAGLG